MAEPSERSTEIPGEGHQVKREIVIRHRPVHIEPDASNETIDWGEPMSEQSFQALKKFVDEYFQKIRGDFSQLTAGDLVKALAEKVRADFPFIEQGTGVATISKQLETFLKNSEQSAQEKAKHADCKLPTVIFLLLCEKFEEILKLESSAILVQRNGSHPHGLLKTTDGRVYSVDYRLKRPDNEDERAVESVVGVRTYDENNDFEKKTIERVAGLFEKLELSSEGLRHLDENFLKS